MRKIHTRWMALGVAGGAALLAGSWTTPARAHDDDHGPPVFNLSFAGGSPAELKAALRKGDGRANLVIVAPAERLRLPAMDLVSVDVEATLDALDGFSQSVDGVIYQLCISAGHGDADDAQPVYVLTAEAQGTEKESGAWSVAQYVERGGDAEALLGSIRNGLAFVGEQAEVRYDPGTRLLMVSGSERAVDLVDEVLDGSIDGLEARDRIHARMVIEEMAVVIESRLRIAELEAQVADLQRRLAAKGG